MKAIVKVISVACMAAALAGCGKMDSKELAEQVKSEMQRDLVKQELYAGLKLETVTLIHKEGIRYEGVGKGNLHGLPIEFEVTCEYDGASVLWKAEPVGENALTLLGRKSGKYCREKFDEKWPKVKEGIKTSYLAAVEKSGRWYEKATAGAAAKYKELLGDFWKGNSRNATNDVMAAHAVFEKAAQTNDYKTCFAIARSFVKEDKGADLAIESCRVAFAAMVKSNPPVAEAHRFLSDLSETASEAYDIVGKKNAASALRKAKKSFLDGASEDDLKAAYQTLMDFSIKEGAFRE